MHHTYRYLLLLNHISIKILRRYSRGTAWGTVGIDAIYRSTTTDRCTRVPAWSVIIAAGDVPQVYTQVRHGPGGSES